MPRLDQSVAVGVGASGALVDVSEFADLDAGVEYGYGRESGFDDVDAGEWSFTLDNGDGRFTPGNTTGAVAAGYSQALQVGAAVCWQLGDRLVSGQVIAVEPEFPGDEAAWAQVRVTCDDALGLAGRTRLAGEYSMFDLVQSAEPYAYWPHNDSSDSSVALDVSSNAQPSFRVPNYFAGSQFATFGWHPIPGSHETQALMVADGSAQYWSTFGSAFDVPDFVAGRAGVFGFRLTPETVSNDLTIWFRVTAILNNGKTLRMTAGGSSPLRMAGDWSTGTTPTTATMSIGISAYFAVDLYVSGSNLVADFYADGVLVGSSSTAHSGATDNDDLVLSRVEFDSGSGTQLNRYGLSDVSYTARLVRGELVPRNSVSGAAQLAAAFVPSISLTTPDATFGIEQTAPLNFSGNVLDALNDVIRTEQGHVYSVTSGSLTSPTQALVVRERDRPISVTATFDVENDLAGAPELIHDLSNLVSSVRVNGPSAEVAVTDSDLRDVAGSASTSERVLSAESHALRTWGQDRLRRGNTVSVRVSAATIDAMTTAADRETDLLALVPGDRVRFTGLPSAQLGFSEWDGWLVGAEEEHTTEEHVFTFFFDPVLDPEPVFNDALFAAGDSLSLSAGINSSVTSMSVATTDATFTTDSTDLPLTILVDSEQMTVTAVTSATPQVFTVTRGVNGATAASHSSGASLELIDPDPTDDAVTRANLVNNSSIEVDTTGWSTLNGGSGATFTVARSAGFSFSGSYRLAATCTVAASGQGGGAAYVQSLSPVVGSDYTVSGHMRTSLAAQEVAIGFDWLQSDLSTIIGSTTFGTSGTITSGAYARFTLTPPPAPSGAGGYRIRFAARSGGSYVNWGIGDVLLVDAVLLEQSSSSAPYFDGSFSSTADAIRSWQSTPFGSFSYEVTGGRVTPAV